MWAKYEFKKRCVVVAVAGFTFANTFQNTTKLPDLIDSNFVTS